MWELDARPRGLRRGDPRAAGVGPVSSTTAPGHRFPVRAARGGGGPRDHRSRGLARVPRPGGTRRAKIAHAVLRVVRGEGRNRTRRPIMRFLFRLVVLALAAFGAKSLYDKLAPHSDELKRTGAGFVDRTTTAAREVADRATEATQRVTSSAQEGAAAVKDAVEQAGQVKAAAEDAKDEARSAWRPKAPTDRRRPARRRPAARARVELAGRASRGRRPHGSAAPRTTPPARAPRWRCSSRWRRPNRRAPR